MAKKRKIAKASVCHLVYLSKKLIEQEKDVFIKENLNAYLDQIKVNAQHMENRLFQYRKSIENLGFKRRHDVKNHFSA
jgi:hypothetical protein